MSTLKTATSALTAAVLVTGIGLAWAQTAEEQVQPSDPMAAATTATPTPSTTSEQTPADPNATSTTAAADQASPNPPIESTAQLPANDPATPDSLRTNQAISGSNSSASTSTSANSSDSMTSSTTSSYDNSTSSYSEPAPRADRN